MLSLNSTMIVTLCVCVYVVQRGGVIGLSLCLSVYLSVSVSVSLSIFQLKVQHISTTARRLNL